MTGARRVRRSGIPALRRHTTTVAGAVPAADQKTRWPTVGKLPEYACFPDGGHLFVFKCAGCGAELTSPLTQVSLPVHTRQQYGNGTQLPVLMESGTFAVDPDPWGGPWRMWDEIDPGEAEARGIYAPVHALSDSTPGASVIAPGDIRGTRLIPEKRGDACCGLDGADGPNMTCEACNLPVATRIDDCSLWQAVRLSPDTVHRAPVGSTRVAPLSWAELAAKGEKASPFEPIATWGGRLGSNHYWSWSPRWEAAAGHALAHLLTASQGQQVKVPGGLTSDVFQRTLDALLPPGPPKRRAVLAGPGQPSRTRAPISSSYRFIPRQVRPGHPPAGLGLRRHTWCPCRWECGCGWSLPIRTCRFPRQAASPKTYSATTRSRCSPTTCSGPTGERSSTPWSGCQPCTAHGCARSSRPSRRAPRPTCSSRPAVEQHQTLAPAGGCPGVSAQRRGRPAQVSGALRVHGKDRAVRVLAGEAGRAAGADR